MDREDFSFVRHFVKFWLSGVFVPFEELLFGGIVTNDATLTIFVNLE